MDLLFFAKIIAFIFIFVAIVQVFRVFEGTLRWYFLAFLVSLAGSIAFFLEVEELTTGAVVIDWVKHLFVYVAMIFLYYGWAQFLRVQQQLFDRRAS